MPIANKVFRFLQQDEDDAEERDLSAEDPAILKNYETRFRRTPSVRHRRRPSKGKDQ